MSGATNQRRVSTSDVTGRTRASGGVQIFTKLQRSDKNNRQVTLETLFTLRVSAKYSAKSAK